MRESVCRERECKLDQNDCDKVWRWVRRKVSCQISQVFSPHVAKQRVASQLPRRCHLEGLLCMFVRLQ